MTQRQSETSPPADTSCSFLSPRIGAQPFTTEVQYVGTGQIVEPSCGRMHSTSTYIFNMMLRSLWMRLTLEGPRMETPPFAL